MRDFSHVKRVVIKIGTSLVRQSGHFDRRFLEQISAQVARLKKDLDITIVSSGAVGLGMDKLKLKRRPTDIAGLQAAAAVGQPELMRAWSDVFRKKQLSISQVLLTNDGLHDRVRFLNAKSAIYKLIELGVIPIVNENDTVAVEELTFGDNDKLAVLVAAMIDADLLINLSNVEGFLNPDSAKKSGERLSKVEKIISAWCDIKAVRGHTIGGIAAKIRAAKISMQMGVPYIIANGRTKDILQSILEGADIGTYFVPSSKGIKGKKRWLSFFTRVSGEVEIDVGAVRALKKGGKSLLPGGIVSVKGDFARGSLVSINDNKGNEFARGISFYSAREIRKISGGKSSDIYKLLKLTQESEAPAEVVHRNNLTLTA